MSRNIIFKTALETFFLVAINSMQVAQAAPQPDACALVTPAQVSAVLGVTVGVGHHLVPSSTNLCGFGSPDAQKRVVIAIIKETMFINEKTPLKGIPKESASGIGDEAHYVTTPGFGTSLSVRKGNFAFKVRVYGFSLDQIKAKEKALALNALANAKL
jgi:hypothetical protein